MKANGMKAVMDKLNEQEYDTDAIQKDLCNSNHDSNLYHLTKAKQYRIIKCYDKSVTLMDGYTFHPGIIVTQNTPKYDSLKEEMLCNTICNLSPYQFNILLFKATKYILSAKAQKLMFHRKVITVTHLLVICIYCCCTELSTAFSTTFRKSPWNESLVSLRSRNSEFGHMRNCLFQTVKQFGQNYLDDDNKGPFFCGMSSNMVLNQFRIKLFQPTSTSKEINVAQRFGTKNGIVIQLNNTGYRSRHCKSFDASWLSDYPTENEYLFCGLSIYGNILEVEAVIRQHQNKNYKEFFKPLMEFEGLFQQSSPEGLRGKISKKSVEIWRELISYQLGLTDQNSYPMYIHETFHAFVTGMKDITLDLSILNPEGSTRTIRYEETLVVNNLTRHVTKDKLMAVFNNFRHKVSINICRDESDDANEDGLVYAYINYDSTENALAQTVLHATDGRWIDNRRISVTLADRPQPRESIFATCDKEIKGTLLKCLFVEKNGCFCNVMSHKIFELFPFVETIRILAYDNEFCLWSFLNEIDKYSFAKIKGKLTVYIAGYHGWNNRQYATHLVEAYAWRGFEIERRGSARNRSIDIRQK